MQGMDSIVRAMERQARAELNVALERFAEWLEWPSAEATGFAKHRDSDALERSNFDVIAEDLRSAYPDDVNVMTMGHWGHGWVDRVVYNSDAEGIREDVGRWESALADYPVADEERYSEYEYDDTHYDGECYADDPRYCGCGFPFWADGTYGVVCPVCERVLTETAPDRELAAEIVSRHTRKRHPEFA